MDDYKWYALYTKSRAEKKSVEKLSSIGITSYLPLKRELKQWSDRKKWVESPIINSYVFIHITPVDYHKVFSVPSIVAYVSHKGKAVTIPDEEMEAMRKVVESKLNISATASDIKKGETITITSGPLKGVSGEIIDIRGNKKLHLRINNIGYTLVIDLENGSY